MRRRGALGIRAAYVAELRRLERGFPGIAKRVPEIEAGAPVVFTVYLGGLLEPSPDTPMGSSWCLDEDDTLTEVRGVVGNPSGRPGCQRIVAWEFV